MGRDGGAGPLRAASRSRRCAASLGAAGVPVEVASDELPLVRDPAALPLIDALRAVLNLDNDDPDHVDHVDAGRAEALLDRPARRPRRRRRTPPGPAAAHPREGAGPGGATAAAPLARAGARARSSTRASLDGARRDRGRPGPARWPSSLRAHPRAARRGRDRRGAALDAVVRHRLAARLRRSVERGGGAARRAHRDLDSIWRCSSRRRGPRRPATTSASETFLATLVAQQIPADTLAERGARGAAVRLLTAHRAKGLEWRLVVVAHVQQDGWPDLRRRSTLLGADRIGTDGLVPPTDRASCWSRSAGSSTSPAPAPASGWSSPRSVAARTTATSRPGSSTSSA